VAALAAGASLLIHEATFADGMEMEACDKRHTTTREALTVARSAGVHATLLYHFSQRYPKLPAIPADVTHPVCVAFDFMTVRGRDLKTLPALWPALCAVYDNSMAEDGGGGQ
jgi:ribonuclease Z